MASTSGTLRGYPRTRQYSGPQQASALIIQYLTARALHGFCILSSPTSLVISSSPLWMWSAVSTIVLLLSAVTLVAGAPTEDVDVENEGVYTLQYSGNWTISRTDTSSHGGSSSYTTTPGDAFELRFNGTSIEFYGTSSPASAKFAVHLDGTSHGTCDTSVTESPANNVLLWSLGNLSNDTEHVFHVAHNDTQGKILSLDWLSYSGTPPGTSNTPVGASNSPTTPSPSPSSATVDASKSKPNRTATIVGGFFGAVLGIALLLVLLFFWLRRGRHQARTTQISGIDHGSRRMSSGDYMTDSFAGRFGAGTYSAKDIGGATATWAGRHDEYGGVDKAYINSGGGKWEGRTDMRPKTSIMLSSLKRKVSVLNPAVALAHLSKRSIDRGSSRDINASSGGGRGDGVENGGGAGVGRSNSFGNIKTSLSGLFSKTGRHSGQPSPDSYESRSGSANRYAEDVKAPVPVPHLYNSYKSRPSTDAGPGARPLLTTGPAVPFQIPVLDNGGALDPTTITRPDPALLSSTATTTNQPLSSKFPTTESIRIPLLTKPNLRDLPSPPIVPPPNQTSFPTDSGAPSGTASNRASAASPTMDFTSPSTGTVVYSHPFNTPGIYQPVKSSASMHSRKGSDAIVDISDIGSATHGNSYGGANGGGYHPYAPYAADYGKRSGTGNGPFGGSTSSLQFPDSASVDTQTYSSHAPLREGAEKGKGKAAYEPGRNVVELSSKGTSTQETSSVRSGGARELPPIPNAAPPNGHVRSNSDASLIGRPTAAAATTTGAAARSEWGTFHKFPSTSSLTQPQTQQPAISRNPEYFSHSRQNSFSSYDRINLGMHNRNNSTPSISYYPNATSADGLARSYDQTVFTRPESRASSVSSKRFSNQLFSR